LYIITLGDNTSKIEEGAHLLRPLIHSLTHSFTHSLTHLQDKSIAINNLSVSAATVGVIHVTRGKLATSASAVTDHGDCIVFPTGSMQKDEITVTALEDSELLLLMGEHVDEPAYSNGPFIASNPISLARINSQFNKLVNPFWAHTLSNEEFTRHVEDLQLQARLKE